MSTNPKRSFVTRAATSLVGLAGLVLAAAPAAAGEFTVEGFVGYYDADSVDDSAEIFGGRLGMRPNEHFGMLLSVGVIDLEDQILEIEDDELRYGFFLADLSFQWFPTGSGFYLFAGPGYSDIELEINLPGTNNDVTTSEAGFTANAGLGYKWNLGESFFLRPEAKARWFDGQDFEADSIDSYDGLDTEVSLGIGWTF
jgi:hypothetical protein